MKYKFKHSNILNLQFALFIATLYALAIPYTLLAQDTFHISYGESISLELKNSEFHFTFIDQNTYIQLDNNKINQYIFKTPGIYIIEVRPIVNNSRKHDCTDITLPKLINVYVDSIKIKVHYETAKTIKSIIKNESTEGNEFIVEMQVENFNKNNPIKINQRNIKTAGIGTTIIGDLDPVINDLLSGVYKFNYLLSGKCTESSYLQFDFVHPNGTIDPITLKTPISSH